MNGEHHESGERVWRDDPGNGSKMLDELSQEEILRALAGLDERIEANNDEDAYSLLARGMLHSRLGDDRRAVEDFSLVIELEPHNAEALENLATARDALGEHHLAKEDYDAVIRLEQDNGVALYSRGACLAQLGDLAGALEDFDQSIALEPGRPGPVLQPGVHPRRDGRSKAGADGLRPGHLPGPWKPRFPPLPRHGPPGVRRARLGCERL